MLENSEHTEQAIPENLEDGDDAGSHGQAQDSSHARHELTECHESVLEDPLAVGLLQVDVDQGGVLSHVPVDVSLEPVDPRRVPPQPLLVPPVITTIAPHHRVDLATQTWIPLLQRPLH